MSYALLDGINRYHCSKNLLNMIDDLKSIAIFATVVEQGSFRGAARKLKLSPSVVSYHITALEKKLDAALLYRSTRKLSLTSQGRKLQKVSETMLYTVEQGLLSISEQNETLSGKLTISLPTALTRSYYSRSLANFCKQHPSLKVDIIYSDIFENLIEKGIDIAIRAGELPSSDLKSKRLGQIERKLVCHPKLLEQQTPPKQPQDLIQIPWVKLSSLPAKRRLTHPIHESVEIEFIHNVSVNSVEGMTQLCIDGLGAATPPAYLVSDYLNTGALIELIPDWRVSPIPVFAIWPNNAMKKSATMRLVAHLAKAIT
ncbi:LysR family transcriptional regulator [Pseudoalteromonas luteoviolacea]|uniref:LysR family transcriptional regulator n=1 Tax=Pseudoalteromonas luteoviolacea TaxID=43657 RepID=UPI00163C450E|nr:LysR family transcriptional regulator [Pseudoalteromonas luteoviolacea]